jgi:ribosomal protein L7Ae-like RNA K-turn-binding protein
MISRKAASMLSLARRAGKLISGEDTVLMALKDGLCHLIIITEDAADNTKKKIKSRAEGQAVRCVVTATRDELSAAVGMYNRAVFAVTDKGFAEKIEAELMIDENVE